LGPRKRALCSTVGENKGEGRRVTAELTEKNSGLIKTDAIHLRSGLHFFRGPENRDFPPGEGAAARSAAAACARGGHGKIKSSTKS
jgi:hypothetical protein